MNNKTVSVIMGVYNCEKTIGESIDSIVGQTYSEWELIICDDGSLDNTYNIIKKYEERYPSKIVVLKNGKNSKLPYTLNHCLKYAKGDYIARMDGDDKSYPERFEKQVAYLNSHPEIMVVGTGMTCFTEDGVTGYRAPIEKPSRNILGKGVPFFHATVMMRKEVYEELGGYSLQPYVLRCEDVDLWIRFFAHGYRGANIQEALYYVREDMEAARRRNLKNGLNASKTLYKGFSKNNYPIHQYVYILKPIISTLIPYKLKYIINQIRWKK